MGDSTLEIGAGTFENFGTVLLGSNGYYNTIVIDHVVQLQGGGTIEMAQHSTGVNSIQGEVSYPNQLIQLDNVDNDIAGSGVITGLYFDNQANGILETNSSLGAGTLELLQNNIAGQGFQNEGHIFADDGGTLELNAPSGGRGFFNFGTLYMESHSDATNLEIGGDVVLKGGGSVTLSDSFYNYIESNGQAATLENVDNFISGSGQAYDVNLTIMNDSQGTIAADHADTPLLLYTGSNAIINLGLLQAVNGATLDLYSDVANGGTLQANGGNVDIAGVLSGYGKTEIFSGSQLELLGSWNQAALVFENNTTDSGVLQLAHSLVSGGSSAFTGTVAGLYERRHTQRHARPAGHQFCKWRILVVHGKCQRQSGRVERHRWQRRPRQDYLAGPLPPRRRIRKLGHILPFSRVCR